MFSQSISTHYLLLKSNLFNLDREYRIIIIKTNNIKLMLVDLSFNQLLHYVCKLIYSKQSIFRYIAGQNCKDLTFVKAKR